MNRGQVTPRTQNAVSYSNPNNQGPPNIPPSPTTQTVPLNFFVLMGVPSTVTILPS